MEERIGVCVAVVGKPQGRKYLEDLGVDGRIILNGS